MTTKILRQPPTPAVEISQKPSLPTISPKMAVSGVVVAAGGMVLYGIYSFFNSPERLGQGGVSYQNEEKLKGAIANIEKSIDKSKLPKNNVYYKNVAQSLYQILNNEMFALDFGIFTKYTHFPRIVNLCQPLSAEEQKQVVVEFNARPRFYLFEFGAAGSLFDWFERMLSISQIEILAQIFAKSNLWRTPKSLLEIKSLFKMPVNKAIAGYWSPWIKNSSTLPEVKSTNAFPIAGNTQKVLLYNNQGKVVDSFRPTSYISPLIDVAGAPDSSGPTGSKFIVGYFMQNIVSENGKNLRNEVIAVDARYFNKTAPPTQLINQYKLT